jgi:K(+)-stimulated pyrophosphate-energized sodium pump
MEIQTLAIIVAPIVAVLALLYGAYITRKVLSLPEGSQKMKDVSLAIRQGAGAYLMRQFKTIALFLVVLFAALWLALGSGIALAFLLGAFFSALAGYIGMQVAVRANVRTAEAAKKSLDSALQASFGSGMVNGLLVTGLALLGVSILYVASYFMYSAQGWDMVASQALGVLIGFGFGANLIALFMRVGGGIYTKAADVGADLVGKVEKGIPEDDPRNPATIADNVGDNVGDCAGMGADVFESYAIAMIAAMILGSISGFGLAGVAFPLLVNSVAIVAAVIGAKFVHAKERDNPMNALNMGFLASNVLAGLGFLYLSYVIFNDLRPFAATIVGLAAAQVVAKMTEYYTSYKHAPVRKIAEAARTGAGTNLIAGLGYGMESAVVAALIVVAAIGLGYMALGFYGIALVALGMLATTAFIMAMDSMGPISDNANGIGEMAGIEESARKRLDALDAVGNTTKALTKGFAISSAAIAATALFSTYVKETGLAGINVGLPPVFIGLLIGAALPFLFASITMGAVGRAAFLIVEEVRRQFKDPGIMKGTKKPDYARCVDISTKAAISELLVLAAIVIIVPLVVGFGLGAEALGGFLVGAIVAGQLMAVFMANAGGAWDNAKKYIESGHLGGKGSDTHKAAVVGDTVGDPFKDTAGPALNPMIKILQVIALLIAGLLVGKGFIGV